MARAAVLGRLTWRVAEVLEVVAETPRVKTIAFDVPGWPGHRAGQHVDIRLTAEDGYQAQRSYSITSTPDGTRVELKFRAPRRRRGLPVPDRRAPAGRPDRAAWPRRRLLRVGAGARGAATDAVGAMHVYRGGGIAMRCPHCDKVLVRIVKDDERVWIRIEGVLTLQVTV